MSEPDVLLHDVPFPKVLRIGLCAAGVIVVFLVTYELWRGVWPLNLTSPFFAIIVFGGWLVGFAVFLAGLLTGPKIYEFRLGEFTVSETLFRRTKRKSYPVAEIANLKTITDTSSDGPDVYYVEITTTSGAIHKSRMFDTVVTARKFEAEFRRALGL